MLNIVLGAALAGLALSLRPGPFTVLAGSVLAMAGGAAWAGGGWLAAVGGGCAGAAAFQLALLAGLVLRATGRRALASLRKGLAGPPEPTSEDRPEGVPAVPATYAANTVNEV